MYEVAAQRTRIAPESVIAGFTTEYLCRILTYDVCIPLAMERVVRGHHVFRATWTPWTGQMLQVHAEAQDRYAVAILVDDAIIGHVPCEFTQITWHFLQRGGTL